MFTFIKNLFRSKSTDFKPEDNFGDYEYTVPTIPVPPQKSEVRDDATAEDELIFEKFKKLIKKYPPSEWHEVGVGYQSRYSHPSCEYKINKSVNRRTLGIDDIEFRTYEYKNLAYELWVQTIKDNRNANIFKKREDFLKEDF